MAITPGYVDSLVAEARQRSPNIAAAEARADSAGAAVQGIRTWDDPVASFGYTYFTPRGMDAAQQGDLAYGLQEKLPLFGKPELQRKEAETAAVRQNLETAHAIAKTRWDLAAGLVDLALADRTVELTREDLDWLDALREAVDHRYRVGQASQVEWLKIQTERATVADDLKTMELERGHREVALNRLLNRDLHSAWPPLALPPAPRDLPDMDALLAAATAAEPDLRVMREEVREAKAMADMTERQRRPDISVGIQGTQYSGDGGIRQAMGTVSVSLPWLNRRRYDHDVERDLAKMRASRYDAEDYQLRLTEDVHHRAIDLDAAERKARLYERELIPLADQTLDSATAAWSSSRGLFQDVLDARRMVIADRLAQATAQADAAKVVAELCYRTGARDLSSFFPKSAAVPGTRP